MSFTNPIKKKISIFVFQNQFIPALKFFLNNMNLQYSLLAGRYKQQEFPLPAMLCANESPGLGHYLMAQLRGS